MQIRNAARVLPQPSTRTVLRPVAARPVIAGSSSFAAAPARAQATGGDPNAQRLLGLQRGSTGRAADVKQLQDDLIAQGCLDPSIRSNAGYGNTFGPMTEAAVKKLQADRGLPVTGKVDAATVAALGPQTPPAPIVPGVTYPGAPVGDPNAAAVVGLQKGLGTPAQVKQLQDDLLRMGYVDPSFAKDGGYGKTFGPKTEAAVKQFQQDNGLPPTGTVDAATAAALAGPRPRTAPVAVGPALAHRAELGLPIGAPQTLADGSVRQDFDRGYVLASADGMLYVRTANGTDLAPPQKLGTASSVAEANQSFLSQWGPTPWNSAQGAPYGYEDCGPTSVAMALGALGLVPHPSPENAEATIDAMRDAAIGRDTTKSQLTGNAQLIKAIEANGGAATTVAPITAAAIDAAIAAGHPMIVGSGTTWSAWGKAQSAAGDYLNHQNPGGHYVTVLGKTPGGNYLVADPLSKTGTIEISAAQLTTLLSGAWDGVEVSRK